MGKCQVHIIGLLQGGEEGNGKGGEAVFQSGMEKDEHGCQAGKEKGRQRELFLFRQGGKKETPGQYQNKGSHGQKEGVSPGIGKEEGNRSGGA